jgi:ribosomal protein S18 acetylase RimI-like enzyme
MTGAPDILCRRIEQGDVPAVASMFCSAFVSMENEVSRAEERIENDTSGAVVAVLEDQVIGALFFDHKAAGNRRAVYIDQVAVLPHHRRFGVCTVLMDWIDSVALSSGCRLVFLLVNIENTAAVGCYTKNGFVVRDSGVFVPSSDDPMIIRMERDLAPARQPNDATTSEGTSNRAPAHHRIVATSGDSICQRIRSRRDHSAKSHQSREDAPRC